MDVDVSSLCVHATARDHAGVRQRGEPAAARVASAWRERAARGSASLVLALAFVLAFAFVLAAAFAFPFVGSR